MTIDEAVRCNKQLRLFMIAEDAANDTNRFLEESYEALDMAIKALETVERIEARKQELEKKMHSNFSFSEVTEHYALVKLLREAENDE